MRPQACVMRAPPLVQHDVLFLSLYFPLTLSFAASLFLSLLSFRLHVFVHSKKNCLHLAPSLSSIYLISQPE